MRVYLAPKLSWCGGDHYRSYIFIYTLYTSLNLYQPLRNYCLKNRESNKGLSYLFFSHKYSVKAKFLVPYWGDIVDFDNSMPESTIPPNQGLRILTHTDIPLPPGFNQLIRLFFREDNPQSTEVEVIKLNSAKIYRFLQLLSHRRVFC